MKNRFVHICVAASVIVSLCAQPVLAATESSLGLNGNKTGQTTEQAAGQSNPGTEGKTESDISSNAGQGTGQETASDSGSQKSQGTDQDIVGQDPQKITNTEITNTEITNTEITNTEITNTEIANAASTEGLTEGSETQNDLLYTTDPALESSWMNDAPRTSFYRLCKTAGDENTAEFYEQGFYTVHSDTWNTDVHYYIDENGYLAAGFFEADGKKYRAAVENPDGSDVPWGESGICFGQLQKGWQKIEGTWYYYDLSTYAARTKWMKTSKYWYYFMPETGAMVTGIQQINGKTYCFNGSGAMLHTGWKKVEGKWYYLAGANNGSAFTGWKKVGKKWYYFDRTAGNMYSGWQEIAGKTYYFGAASDGEMKTKWQKIDGSWYYFGTASKGYVHYNWQKIGSRWYYFDRETGIMQSGWQEIYGKTYYLGSANSGAMRYGIQKIDGNSYYFGSSNGGAMQYGWKKVSGYWYYFDKETGIMKTGWLKLGEDWYYLYSDGKMAQSCWVKNYYVDRSGKWLPDYQGMTWPLPGYSTISSDYGYRGYVTAGATTYHKGIDLPAPYGTPIVAAMDGTVVASTSSSSAGLYVKIKHIDGISTSYMHMSSRAVSTGQTVKRGQVIGYVGSTGVSTGNHLHFAVDENGTYVSPWNYLTRP